MGWYLKVLRQYADFQGRARRKEYWTFFLINTIVTIALVNVHTGLADLYTLATLVPATAVSVRRLHDTGRSGFQLFLGLIPFIGAVILLIFFAEDSMSCGQNPKNGLAALRSPQLLHQGREAGMKLKDLFSDVFGKHTPEEVEEYFTVGTATTTPPIENVDTTWPKPWAFSRTFTAALVVYILFLWGWIAFHNENLIPGLIMIGSFAVPIATLIFFFEMNVRRNVSLFQVIRLLFMGGILSLLFTLRLYKLTAPLGLEWLGDSIAGLVEEPGKLLAVWTVAWIPKYRYKLNGLLFGAAVGAGFSAFESAGYAMRLGLLQGKGLNMGVMNDIIVRRGMLSPFGHIAWTAMSAGALWRVKGAKKFSLAMHQDIGFLKVFALAVVLHMLWNAPILPFLYKYVLLGSVAWGVIQGLIQEGLEELRAEKAAALAGRMPEVPIAPPGGQ